MMLKALFLFHLQEHDLDEDESQVYLFTVSYVLHYLLMILMLLSLILQSLLTTCFSRQFACQMRLWLIFLLVGFFGGVVVEYS